MNKDKKVVKVSLRKSVFFPPWIFLVSMVIISLINANMLIDSLNTMTKWILDNFAWAFNMTVVSCIGTVIFVYFSPLGKVRIGGSNARPMMKFSDLVWITLCTTIAAGILFWACAEPIYHMYTPAISSGAEGGSKEAVLFAMEVMFLEWTWSPYAIYTVATLIFAFAFYNMKQPYSLGAALAPILGEKSKKFNHVVDSVCLFALVAGMAASLGTGTMTIGGGIEKLFGVKSGEISWGIIIIVIVTTFIVSSVSGVMKGIRLLSSINIKVYIVLLIFVFLFGPTSFILNLTTESWGAYATDFLKLNMMNGAIYDDEWVKNWPIFYWCNWLAWTPITAVFLGKILRGYTVKDAIKFNFIIPAVFSTVWMGLFSSTSIYYELTGKKLYDILLEKGTESVIYEVFEQLPLAMLTVPFYLFIVFISFVTASDSNTNAMAGLCTVGLNQDNQESPAYLKIIWGVSIGIMTWLLISFAGIDGIKAASNLGGFPNMFLIILMMIGLIKIGLNPKHYDRNQEDYDSEGNPIISKRLPIEEE